MDGLLNIALPTTDSDLDESTAVAKSKEQMGGGYEMNSPCQQYRCDYKLSLHDGVVPNYLV